MKTISLRQRLLHSTMVGGAALMALVAAPAATMLMPTAASAQDYTSGVMSGAVRDESGNAVSGASVTATSAQGTARTATTDANGSFRLVALPVGSYTVQIEQSGFAPLTQRAVVSPGGVSYVFDLKAGDSAANVDDIVVTAKRVQDFAATDTGMVVDVLEFADRVPTGRSINAVTLFTPGASIPDASINASSNRNQSLVSLSGTSAAESVYYINGLNVTDQRNFLGYGELPFDFIQTIETKTGGYQAEFGRGTGGIINIITRSGTNEWTGGVSTYFTPNFLRGTRGEAWSQGGTSVSGVQILNQYAYGDTKDYTAYLGGPIWKDHLFVFGTYNVRDVENRGPWSRNYIYSASNPSGTPGASYSQNISSYDDPRWALKLDFVINPNHRIEATVFNDETTTTNQTRTFNASTLDQTAITDPLYSDAGGLIQIYKYTGIMTDWFTLSGLFSRLENTYLDYGNPIGLPGVYDEDRPGGPGYVTAGRQAGPYNFAGGDVRKTYRLDGDFYFDLFGEHHLRIGYDKEELTSVAKSAYTGGVLYDILSAESCEGVAPEGLGCVLATTFANDGTFTADQTALYIQDSWDIAQNFSVQLGLRNDRYEYNNIDGEAYVTIEDQWAPRVGFNWDPFGQGLDRVYGSMGDYYLPIATNTSIRASSGEIYTAGYYGVSRNASGNVVLDSEGRPVLGAEYGFEYYSPPGAPDRRTVAKEGLAPMYEREYILGYERRFTEGMLADWSFGVRAVYRNLESAIEDTAIGDAVYRYCERTDNPACGELPTEVGDIRDYTAQFPYVLINPGQSARVFIDLQGDARAGSDGTPNPAYNPQWVELTEADLLLPEVDRSYKALELTFERPFNDSWGVQGSYTLAESKGNYEGPVKSDIGQTDTSITQDYDHSANQLGSFGYLPNHHRHTFKVFGSWAPTDWLNIGANFIAQSGRKYGCIGRVPLSVDPLAPTGGTPSGWYCPFGPNNSTVQTPRGSLGETPWVYQVDLNLSFDVFKTEDRGNLSATVDIFNLFDNDETLRVVEQGLVRTADNNMTARSPYWGRSRSYQAPRSIRFGLRYRF